MYIFIYVFCEMFITKKKKNISERRSCNVFLLLLPVLAQNTLMILGWSTGFSSIIIVIKMMIMIVVWVVCVCIFWYKWAIFRASKNKEKPFHILYVFYIGISIHSFFSIPFLIIFFFFLRFSVIIIVIIILVLYTRWWRRKKTWYIHSWY